MQSNKLIPFLQKSFLFLGISLFGIFAFPISSAYFVLPKDILLVITASLSIIFWVLGFLSEKKAVFSVGKFDLGVLFISLVYLVSTFVNTPNKAEAFFFPGSTTFLVSSIVFYFLINQLDKKGKSQMKWAAVVSGVFISLAIVATETGLLAKIPQLPALFKDPGFNPMGGLLPSLIVLASFLPITLGQTLLERSAPKKALAAATGAVIALTLGLLIYKLMPGMPQSPRFLAFSTSWGIATDTVKVSPMLGIGPSNYLTAFNRFRPVTYNLGEFWNLKFTTARNFYLTFITETGLVGLLSLIFLFALIFKSFSKKLKAGNLIENGLSEASAFLVLAILFGVFPAAPALIFPFFVLLAFISDSEDKTVELSPTPSGSKTIAAFVGLPLAALIAWVFFIGTKMMLAEIKYSQSLKFLSENNAQETYNFMREAIRTYPKIDRYHLSFAQVNLALASSIAAKGNLTDTDKSNVAQLVQQAIAEGKAAVSLNPQRSGNWEALARTYRNIMAFANGADNFTIQTLTQAAVLDPINPNIRIALGGTFYALGRFDEAVEAFRLAVTAKPDLANAHYNLSAGYREKKDYDRAIEQMNIVISLVEKDSDDYKQAKTELEALEKEKPVKPEERSETLIPPTPVEEPVIVPPITLPEEANPPIEQ